LLEADVFGFNSNIIPAVHYIFSFFKEKKEKDVVSIRAIKEIIIFYRDI
jgi:hypothetical protein